MEDSKANRSPNVSADAGGKVIEPRLGGERGEDRDNTLFGMREMV